MVVSNQQEVTENNGFRYGIDVVRGASRSDEWYTPRYAVEIIVPYLKRFSHVWCPFDTEDSEFVKVLREHGKTVTPTHIWSGQDLYTTDVPRGTQVIVSNPPFSQRDQVFERCFGLGLPFALIGNANSLFDSKKRFDLFATHNFEILVPRGRVEYLSGEGITNKGVAFQSVYVCSGVLPKQIVFTEMSKSSFKLGVPPM